MRFQKDAWERYSVLQNQAMRVVRKGAANGENVTLPVLETVLDQNKVAGEVDLGVVDIPVDQIVGIASNSDKESYTSDFLPLPSVKSAFAEKWTQLFMAQLSDTGLKEPIRCYEYLGKFYVVDGKMRVSAVKAVGSIMMKANVVRIMPVMTDEPKIQSYYEFVKAYEKTGLYQIAFSQPGKTNKFLETLGYDPDYVWNETDRYCFMFHWYPFERALQVAFDGLLNITAADAVMVLLRKYEFADLRDTPSWTLAELMQGSWVEMYQVADPNFKLRIASTQKAS